MSELSKLQQEVKDLKRKLRQPVRQHASQSKQARFIKRDPVDIQHGELEDKNINFYKNEKTNEYGLVVRIGGKKIKFTGSEV